MLPLITRTMQVSSLSVTQIITDSKGEREREKNRELRKELRVEEKIE